MIISHLQEEREIPGTKAATAHLVWRCGFCQRESSAKFDSSYAVRPYSSDVDGKFGPLLVIECRGLEFTNFDPRVSVTVLSAGP